MAWWQKKKTGRNERTQMRYSQELCLSHKDKVDSKIEKFILDYTVFLCLLPIIVGIILIFLLYKSDESFNKHQEYKTKNQ